MHVLMPRLRHLSLWFWNTQLLSYTLFDFLMRCHPLSFVLSLSFTLSLSLSRCLSISLSRCLTVSLSLFLSVDLLLCRSVSLSLRSSVSQSRCLSVSLSLAVSPSRCLAVSLVSVSLSLFPLCRFVSESVSLSLCLTVALSRCLSIFLTLPVSLYISASLCLWLSCTLAALLCRSLSRTYPLWHACSLSHACTLFLTLPASHKWMRHVTHIMSQVSPLALISSLIFCRSRIWGSLSYARARVCARARSLCLFNGSCSVSIALFLPLSLELLLHYFLLSYWRALKLLLYGLWKNTLVDKQQKPAWILLILCPAIKEV